MNAITSLKVFRRSKTKRMKLPNLPDVEIGCFHPFAAPLLVLKKLKQITSTHAHAAFLQLTLRPCRSLAIDLISVCRGIDYSTSVLAVDV